MAIWKGSLELQPDPEYPVFRYSDRVTCEMRWNGLHDSCLAFKPVRGAEMPGFGNLRVDDATVSKRPGGAGVLVVNMSDDGTTLTDGSPARKPIQELVWIEQRMPLSGHPRYAAGEFEITPKDFYQLTAWENTIDPDQKDMFQYKVLDWNGAELTGTLRSDGGVRELAERYAKGERHYLDALPVAMTTTFERSVPKGKPCPRILAEALFENCPDGYFWLRTAYRMTRTGSRGKWAIVQQATGSVVAYDTRIYIEEETEE